MKICHITSAHSRYDARIFKRECCSLANAGYDVSLICFDGQEDCVEKNVMIKSYSQHKYTKFERFKLLLKNRSIVNYLIELEADFYQFHDFELVEIGRKLQSKGCRVIFDSHENWPGYLANSFAKTNSLLYKLIHSFVEIYYRYVASKFTAIFTVSPNLVNFFKKYNSNSYMVPNFPSKSGIKQRDCSIIKNEFLYQGCVYDFSNQETITQTIQLIKHDVSYKIVGSISDSLQSVIKSLDKNNLVSIIGWVTPEELSMIMSSSLAGVVLLDYVPICCGKEGQLGSNKIFEYMKQGLPIICTDFKLWKELIVDKYKCGICVPPNNVDELKKAIEYILMHRQEAMEMGIRGQEAILKEFNWELYETDFIKRYREL